METSALSSNNVFCLHVSFAVGRHCNPAFFFFKEHFAAPRRYSEVTAGLHDKGHFQRVRKDSSLAGARLHMPPL